MGTDLIGTPTKHSVSQIESADHNVLEKLNKIRWCEEARVCSSYTDTIHILRQRRIFFFFF